MLTTNMTYYAGSSARIIAASLNVAQLGRQVVQISKTAHPIAKLVTPTCLACACNHQKSNCLMIRVCLGNSQISLIDPL